MKRIYKGKTKLRIQIDTKCDLSGYEEVNVIAKKPDDTIKTFPAVVKDVENGLIFFDIHDLIPPVFSLILSASSAAHLLQSAMDVP